MTYEQELAQLEATLADLHDTIVCEERRHKERIDSAAEIQRHLDQLHDNKTRLKRRIEAKRVRVETARAEWIAVGHAPVEFLVHIYCRLCFAQIPDFLVFNARDAKAPGVILCTPLACRACGRTEEPSQEGDSTNDTRP